jgi:prepilin-type N-terminal cleavage/methylation domain-containing protein
VIADRQPPRRREAGFTLLELVVATAVLLLAVLLACDLLSESGRLLHHSVRRARDPWTLLPAELLRNDLRGTATPLVLRPLLPPELPPLHAWQTRAMLLQTADGQVTWQRLPDGRVTRRAAGGVGRVYLQDAASFRWRLMEANAVEVWVRYHVSSPYLRQLAGGLPKSDPGEDHDLHLLVVARGNPGTQAW